MQKRRSETVAVNGVNGTVMYYYIKIESNFRQKKASTKKSLNKYKCKIATFSASFRI